MKKRIIIIFSILIDYFVIFLLNKVNYIILFFDLLEQEINIKK